MADYFDALETRSPNQREIEQFELLGAQLQHAREHSVAYSALLSEVEPATVTDRAALARLPVTRKSDMAVRQAETPPLADSLRLTRVICNMCLLLPGVFLSRMQGEQTIGTWGAHYTPLVFGPVIWSTTRFLTTLRRRV